MKLSKWVDFGQEVEIEIDSSDICAALAEAFEPITRDPLGEEGPSCRDVTRALNSMATFLNALMDGHIARMTPKQREIVADFLAKAAPRFAAPRTPSEAEEAGRTEYERVTRDPKEWK